MTIYLNKLIQLIFLLMSIPDLDIFLTFYINFSLFCILYPFSFTSYLNLQSTMLRNSQKSLLEEHPNWTQTFQNQLLKLLYPKTVYLWHCLMMLMKWLSRSHSLKKYIQILLLNLMILLKGRMIQSKAKQPLLTFTVSCD